MIRWDFCEVEREEGGGGGKSEIEDAAEGDGRWTDGRI